MQHELERILRELPRLGTLLKDRGYRQIWRFEVQGRPYLLKFYPRRGGRLKRLFRGSPAMREFLRLQWLQKASIPAPWAVALLMGLRLKEQVGDAVMLEAIEPSITLDLHLNELQLRGEREPRYRDLARQVLDIVKSLDDAELRHTDLHLGNFLLRDGKVHLLDAYAIQRGPMRDRDLLLLGHSVERFATTGDLLRGWRKLRGDDRPMPRRNRVSQRQWRRLLERITEENRYFGRLASQGWSGHFFRQTKYPRWWASVSEFTIERGDWERIWPSLLQSLDRDGLKPRKRSPSGDVLETAVELAGRRIEIIIKRPRRRYWFRYFNEIGRGGRARRAWYKAWSLVLRDIPTAWPLLLMERRVIGYSADAVIVFAKVPGPLLARLQLDDLPQDQREMLFRRAGRTLRRMENTGLYHGDAKSANWIVLMDPQRGPTPIAIDVDGIRRIDEPGGGMQRLLRSMREHRQYTPADSLALCRGFVPYAPLHAEPSPEIVEQEARS